MAGTKRCTLLSSCFGLDMISAHSPLARTALPSSRETWKIRTNVLVVEAGQEKQDPIADIYV